MGKPQPQFCPRTGHTQITPQTMEAQAEIAWIPQESAGKEAWNWNFGMNSRKEMQN